MQFCQPIPFQALLGHENKTFCGLCTHREGTPQLKVHCSADPQNKLRRQPQKATNMPGGRVRVPSHGAVCVTIAKHESEEHGYSWVISLTNGTSAHPCVPCRREQGKEAEGSLRVSLPDTWACSGPPCAGQTLRFLPAWHSHRPSGRNLPLSRQTPWNAAAAGPLPTQPGH